MIQRTNKLVFIFLLLSSFINAQMNQYNQKREIENSTAQWHRIILPMAVFSETKNNLADIRIYGITKNDTIEAPYILNVKNSTSKNQPVAFRLLNKSNNSKGYHYTYEIPNAQVINAILLNFDTKNFDYRITLQGSQDQVEWFTISDNYRVLSIENTLTTYKFTKLKFPNSSYRYFKITVNSKNNPNLNGAQISKNQVTPAIYNTYPIKKTITFYNKNSKQTTLDIDLKHIGLISTVKINIKDTIDYYRPITIAYALDSVQTEKGWKVNYRNAFSGIVSSLEKNEFSFNSNKAKKIKITINHQDNEPIEIAAVTVQGFQYELITRFNKPAKYYLVYGNNLAIEPVYDIQLIPNLVPEVVKTISLGKPIAIDKNAKPEKKPLFENKNWLWAIMLLMIAIVGWFTLKMIRKS
tara:strand:- start:48219 stop:49448 length:1230 start_codon:yes stop_codon:yes gene_type:complete